MGVGRGRRGGPALVPQRLHGGLQHLGVHGSLSGSMRELDKGFRVVLRLE
ncbi:MAG: hypothetical protein R3F62_12810 [Planctomycetota bacterium]